jgi:hypothetical protein
LASCEHVQGRGKIQNNLVQCSARAKGNGWLWPHSCLVIPQDGIIAPIGFAGESCSRKLPDIIGMM